MRSLPRQCVDQIRFRNDFKPLGREHETFTKKLRDWPFAVRDKEKEKERREFQ